MDKKLVNFALQEADRQGVPREFIKAIIQIESSGGINVGPSKAGARGPMQLMPSTAKGLGVNIDDPMDNIRGGVRYYKQQLKKFGDPVIAAAAYNAGPGNVRKYGGIPPFAETRDYAKKFKNYIGMDDASEKKPAARSEVGKPLKMELDEPTPYTPQPVDVESETESNFASLLAKIGMGGKKKAKTKGKIPGILDGLF
jgi:hypothetical protein